MRDRLLRLALPALPILCWACGDGSSSIPATPLPPTSPGPTLESIQVGVAGNAAPSLEPGQSKQMFALGRYSDGTTQDFTNLAVWQTSDPGIATVSNVGLVTAANEGRARILATYRAVTGTLDIDIARAGCRYTLTPPVLVFGAFGGFARINVTTTLSDCRWRVRSDAEWFHYSFDPNRSGDGQFEYSIPGNSTPSAREAEFLIVDGGSNVVGSHRITQEQPVSCSYVTNPRETRLPIAGGRGSFTVVTEPADCRWTVDFNAFLVQAASPSSGQGTTRITFTVGPALGPLWTNVQIWGLSRQNPPGEHRIIWGAPSDLPPFSR